MTWNDPRVSGSGGPVLWGFERPSGLVEVLANFFKERVPYTEYGQAGGVAVLPPGCAPLSPGLIPGPSAVHAFGLVHTCFHKSFSGFSSFPLFFLLTSKTGLPK